MFVLINGSNWNIPGIIARKIIHQCIYGSYIQEIMAYGGNAISILCTGGFTPEFTS